MTTWIPTASHWPSSSALPSGVGPRVFFWRCHLYRHQLLDIHRVWWHSYSLLQHIPEEFLPFSQFATEAIFARMGYPELTHQPRFLLVPSALISGSHNFHSGIFPGVLIPNLHLCLGLFFYHLPVVLAYLRGASFSDSVLRHFTAFPILSQDLSKVTQLEREQVDCTLFMMKMRTY